jgi:hypothetical protein
MIFTIQSDSLFLGFRVRTISDPLIGIRQIWRIQGPKFQNHNLLANKKNVVLYRKVL